jgi:SOS-response transcriptional repressor LexA
MFPTLQKGSTVNLEILSPNQLKNGDIIGVILKGKKEIIFRNCFFIDGKKKKVNLFPMNHSYETATYEMKDIKLIGKAKRIITNLE